MSSAIHLFNSVQAAAEGLTLAEFLAQHPGMSRRTVQRLMAMLIERGHITARGEGRARHYFGAVPVSTPTPPQDAWGPHAGAKSASTTTKLVTQSTSADVFPSFIALSGFDRRSKVAPCCSREPRANRNTNHHKGSTDLIETARTRISQKYPGSLKILAVDRATAVFAYQAVF
jgi:DNA-binding transcriptional MocR family regulator